MNETKGGRRNPPPPPDSSPEFSVQLRALGNKNVDAVSVGVMLAFLATLNGEPVEKSKVWKRKTFTDRSKLVGQTGYEKTYVYASGKGVTFHVLGEDAPQVALEEMKCNRKADQSKGHVFCWEL